MSVLAVITARGGSKRIPRKNIKLFAGKPMLQYAIDAALMSRIFDEVMVSTDDIEIARIARASGAQVPFMRSEKTANDYATTCDVIEEVLTEYHKRGRDFDTVCCIYPCVPFLSAETLRNAMLQMGEHDAIMPVCAYPVPVEWAHELDESGVLRCRDKRACSMRSQDLRKCYYDVGMFYFCKTEKALSLHTICPDDTLGYVIPESECQDIDTMDDWNMAELKYELLKQRNLLRK